MLLTLQVGLALVVEGQIVLGVMGCPNWKDNKSDNDKNTLGSGMIMVAHIGCGTWSKELSGVALNWYRCLVDGTNLVHKGRFCISESQTWDSLPLSSSFGSSINVENVGDNEVLLLPTCCGRSIYFFYSINISISNSNTVLMLENGVYIFFGTLNSVYASI